MYKAGAMLAAPTGQGGMERGGSGSPSPRQLSSCPLAQAGRAALASWLRRDGVPRLGTGPCSPHHAPLWPHPVRG